MTARKYHFDDGVDAAIRDLYVSRRLFDREIAALLGWPGEAGRVAVTRRRRELGVGQSDRTPEAALVK